MVSPSRAALLVLPSALLLCLAACGGDAPEDRGRPAAAFGGGALPADAAIDTLLLVLLDGVRPAELTAEAGAPGLPAFSSLRAASEDLGPAVAATTGGNAAVATALTGLHPLEHGLLSLHDPGRARLDPRLPSLPESLRVAGWRTLGAFPAPRHARALSGFARGFDRFAAPRIGEPARSAGEVVASVSTAFAEALAGDGRVFAAVVFDDPIRRGAPLARAGAADVVARRMAPFARTSGQVAAALELLGDDRDAGLREFERLFARARGSGAARAWAAALAELRTREVDAALGELLGLVEASGRAGRAAVVVAGLRGRADGSRSAGPGLGADALDVPLWVRAPGAAELRSGEGPPSAAGLSALLEQVAGVGPSDGAALPWAGPRLPWALPGALAATPDGTLNVLRTAALHVERYRDGQVVAFQGGERVEVPAVELAPLEGALHEAARAAAVLVGGSIPPELELRWRVARGSRVPELGARRAPPVRGGLGAFTEGRVRALPLTDRGADVRLELRSGAAGGLAPDRVAFGERPLGELPALYLPADQAPPLGAGGAAAPAPRLAFTRADGLTWNLTVSADGLPEGARCEVLLTVWPPRDPAELLEVPATNVELTHVEGRRDLVHLAGTLPFDVLLGRTGAESFAVACAIDGAFLTPDRMASDGAWYAGPAGFDLLVPAWQPAVSPLMGDVTAALFAEFVATPRGAWTSPDRRPPPREFPEGMLSIARRGFGPVPGPGAALPLEALEFVRTLPPGE